jgi:CheY-like chemotaxis protein
MVKVLVIDNSEVIRNLLTEYLTDLGYVVENAINGLDGIEKALSGDYDVVICDIHMPKRNGYQVFSEVSGQKPNLPFIMTDSLPDTLAERAVNEGAYACLSKPFNLDQVKKTIDQLLAKARTK